MAVINTLKERIESYKDLPNDRLMPKLPYIIMINGRSFKKTSSFVSKPFSHLMLDAMGATMAKLASEVENTIFAYSFNDEIILVIKNDLQDGGYWHGNHKQKIASITSSIASIEFNKMCAAQGMQIFGDPIFSSNVFAVPDVIEAINTLICKQQEAFHSAISMAVFYELIKKYDLSTVEQTLREKSSQAKAEILFETCNIDINSYPIPFRRGMACYRAPKIMKIDGDEKIKNKLILDLEVPIFTKNPEFLRNIFFGGKDILRA